MGAEDRERSSLLPEEAFGSENRYLFPSFQAEDRERSVLLPEEAFGSENRYLFPSFQAEDRERSSLLPEEALFIRIISRMTEHYSAASVPSVSSAVSFDVSSSLAGPCETTTCEARSTRVCNI